MVGHSTFPMCRSVARVQQQPCKASSENSSLGQQQTPKLGAAENRSPKGHRVAMPPVIQLRATQPQAGSRYWCSIYLPASIEQAKLDVPTRGLSISRLLVTHINTLGAHLSAALTPRPLPVQSSQLTKTTLTSIL